MLFGSLESIKIESRTFPNGHMIGRTKVYLMVLTGAGGKLIFGSLFLRRKNGRNHAAEDTLREFDV